MVGDVDALLAARTGGHERAVDVENGLVEEVGLLPFPDLDPSLIEDILKCLDVVGREPPAEIACGGRVWDAIGAECVEKDNVVAS
jgi:hypothetical protein